MLEKPSVGWSMITIENFHFPLSYLTDVPNDFLDALIIALKYNVSTFVTVDGESEGECDILFNMVDNRVSAIRCVYDYDERVETKFYDTTVLDFAKSFLDDLERHLDQWQLWLKFEECGDDDYEIPDEKITNLRNLVNQPENQQ